jgi:phosphatidylglycerophosphate synthase
MKKRAKFDLKKSLYGRNPVFISRLLDPYTAKIARFMYNLGFTANRVTLISFILGLSSIAALFIWKNYTGLIIAAVLLTFRNIGDTIDGKIARGSENPTPVGGFSDIIVDWIFFHAAFFIAIGILTNHIIIGFLCVTGYMSREFTRRKFTEKHGIKITETEESKKIPKLVSLIRLYDLASVFWIIPLLLLINQLSIIIYFVAIVEYTLLLGELAFDYYLFSKDKKSN